MSKEKQMQDELTIRKAKYRVKNAEGKYEVVYLETSADQVETTEEMQFISATEKAQIATNTSAIAQEASDRAEADNALKARLDIVEGEEAVEGSIKKALKDAKDYADLKIHEVNGANEALSGRVDALETNVGEGTVDSRIEAAKTEVQGNVDTLAGRVSTTESDISDLKDALANKNSNTVVVNTEEEIATANSNPKVGDLAYVINSKRAYIYKGAGVAALVKSAPEGWVVFDEITSEVDLVNYLKKEEAESTYRKIATKIVEGDLDTALTQKIDSKLDGDQVDSKITAAVTPVSEKANANETAIAEEVSNRTSEISRIEGLITSKTETVDTRVNNLLPAVNSAMPEGTEAGHVWLEIQE